MKTESKRKSNPSIGAYGLLWTGTSSVPVDDIIIFYQCEETIQIYICKKKYSNEVLNMQCNAAPKLYPVFSRKKCKG